MNTPTTLQSLNVNLGERSYPILIGSGLLSQEELLRPYVFNSKTLSQQRRVAIVTNTTVAPLYLDQVQSSLRTLGVEPISVVLPDGEVYKQWDCINQILTTMLEARFDRGSMLIALGGGVIGDMVGFAAAIYQRGIQFIQIPTTLLAQVDSSVGGKTGINHPAGKNMIGAFYQPQAVLIDVATLQTLPERELAAGLAEIIKHGLITDENYFSEVEHLLPRLKGVSAAQRSEMLIPIIRRSCEIKAAVVAQDEKESGLRATLNFGHTFGHAIEVGMGYGTWLHGEAVGAGMVLAADLSRRLGWLNADDVLRVRNVVEAAGLPLQAPPLGVERYLALMAGDKKNEAGTIKFVLLQGIGKAIVTAVPEPLLRETLTTTEQS